MPLDSPTIHGLALELDRTLKEGKVEKVQMPAKGIMLTMRAREETHRLFLSSAAPPLIYLSTLRPENPPEPPMLCMLLRKHLTGGRLIEVSQPDFERVVILRFACFDELRQPCERRLIIELITKRQNIILTDEKGLILGCLRRFSPDLGEESPVLPGLIYRLPKKQDRPLLYTLDEPALLRIAEAAASADEPAFALQNALSGISPLLAREAVHCAKGEAQALFSWLSRFASDVREGRLHPVLLEQDFTCIDMAHVPMAESAYGSFSALLDAFYSGRMQKEGFAKLVKPYRKSLEGSKKRIAKRLALQKRDLEEARNRERLKVEADLITANLHQIRSGEKAAKVVDYTKEDMPEVIIQLDPELSPQQNAQKLYKKYQKLKNADAALTERVEYGERELLYIDSLLYSLSEVQSRQDLELIRQEMMAGGMIKNVQKNVKQKKVKAPAFSPKRYCYKGFELLCGKNNRENDELTFKLAQKRDLWFHAQGVPGSHVVLLTGGQPPGADVIEAACQLAAFYSGNKNAPKAFVDYCEVRHVKRPSGARPGMVNYFEYNTAYVIPRDIEIAPDSEQ